MSTGNKIVTVGGKLGVPYRVVVAFVAHQTCKCLETPQPDGTIFRTGQQVVSERSKKSRTIITLKGNDVQSHMGNRLWESVPSTPSLFFPFLCPSVYFIHLSGLKLMPYTGPLCPWRIFDSLAVFSSMILSSTSSDSLSIRFNS